MHTNLGKLGTLTLVCLILFTALSCDSKTNTPPKIANQKAEPSQVIVNSVTDIIFSAKITDEQGKLDITGVVIDLSQLGGLATQQMFDDGTNGDVTAHDSIYTFVLQNYQAPATTQDYQLEITATDSKNASTFKSILFSVIEPPIINSFTSTQNSANPSETVTFNANVAQGTNPIAKVELDLTQIGGNPNTPMIDNGNNDYSFDWTIPDSSLNGIPPGIYTITLLVEDNATPVNTSTEQITDFKINRANLGVLSFTPDFAQLSTTVLFELSLHTPNGLASIEHVFVDFSPIGIIGNQQMFDDGTNGDVTADDGIFSYEFQDSDWNATLTTTTGYYELDVTITETSGRITKAFVPLLVYTQDEIYVDDTAGNDATGDGSQNNPYKTIKKGVASAIHGSIVLIEDGIYTGDDNRDIRMNGKKIIVKGLNGPNNTRIDCGGANHRGFEIVDNESFDTIIYGLTIENGYVNNTLGFGDDGGGIYILDAGPQIVNCIIRDNITINHGGGIYITGVNNTTLKGPKIIRCIIERNTASRGNGGGIYIYQSLDVIIDNCIIKNNLATNSTANVNGGGIYSYQSNVSITNCVIESNTVRNTSSSTSHSARGGGIYLNKLTANTGTFIVKNCLIIDNLSEAAGAWSQGGGLYLYQSGTNPIISNCTIANNRARVSGSNDPGNAQGGGIFSTTATPIVRNTIIWDNSSTGEGEQIYHYSTTQITTFRNCLFKDSPTDVYDNNNNINKINCLDDEPRFVTGIAGDFYLEHDGVAGGTINSPCIDAGSDTAAILGMNYKTTRVDSVYDTGIVDLGYHYEK